MSIFKVIMLTTLFATFVTLAGCEKKDMKLQQPNWDWAKPKPVEKEDETQTMEFAQLKKDNKKLKEDVENLTSLNAILDGRVKELLAREDRLTQELNHYKLDNYKLREQVKVLGDVPAQRDRYKLQLDSAQKKIVELQDQLEREKKKSN
ncbi:MAG TPA: hypothetical protein PKK48_06175 [Phycisphaerae bacterium]|nr:hypothetical protein [Phycisphaerae bacterium]HPS51953.1 hypothetical protein [Phycisphaerae bacterium]